MSTRQNAQKAKPTAVAQSGLREWLTLRNFCIVLVLAAIGISGYLTYGGLADEEVACAKNAGFNCGEVQNSPQAEVLGIPTALLGLLTNFVLLGLFIFEKRIPFLQDNGLALLFITLFLATLFSIYLIYVQAVEIEAYCQWCLAHEVVVFVLFGIIAWRVKNEIFAPIDEG